MNKTRKYLLLSTILILLFPSISFSANTISGKVIKVVDGDTITILDKSQRKTKIRLYGIDTPEKAQAFGKKAKRFTASLVAGKHVSVKIYDVDRYRRSVGVVYVGGKNVNEEIIRAGFAWQYRKYCKASFCSKWLTLEKMARNAGIGLFADPHATPPWEWRKAKRGGSSRTNYGSSKSSNLVSGGTGMYHGNVRSHVFHGSGCQYYDCKNCTKMFRSKDEAVRAGFKAHKQCVK